MEPMNGVEQHPQLEGRAASGRRIRATWNGAVLAESDRTVVVEGNHYFPWDSLDKRYLRESSTHTVCSWKGVASYFDVVVDEQVNRDAAWYYPEPSPAAAEITDRAAFWHGVKVTPVREEEAVRRVQR